MSFAQNYPLYFSLLILLIGLYGMLMRRHLMQQLIALGIFQASIVLFFVVMAHRWDASVPILTQSIHAKDYINPLPHGLMLTAIVVSVAMTGVGLALLIRIRRDLGSLQEEVLDEG